MSASGDKTTRRGFLGVSAGAVVGVGAAASGAAARETRRPFRPAHPFRGPHQAGIAAPPQPHTLFAAFDVTTDQRADLAALMRAWTIAAEAFVENLPDPETAAAEVPPGPGDLAGLVDPSRTVVFGFGPTLFSKDGTDRFGLAARRPAALIDLPKFTGDQLEPQRTGGDLAVQVSGPDPQTCLNAVRRLSALAAGRAQLRWTQAGFIQVRPDGSTPRNLMGFKDGSMNVGLNDLPALKEFVWAEDDGGWMARGSYMVVRPIRIALEHWDRMKLGFQEQTLGRRKATGAPLGKERETDALDLEASGADGMPLIPETAHVRLAAPASNGGAQILRKSYSYDNGVALIAERWPPWRQAMELDAGLLFVCFQKDPRTGFVKIFDRMSKFDMMNQFVTHVGGGLFACPGGAPPGGYVGQALLEA